MKTPTKASPDPSPMDEVLEDLSQVPIERLEAAISAGAARIAAMQCKWLLLLAEFIARGGNDRWGMTPEHWLSWRCGLDRVTAREHLRVARCIVELPTVRAAFGAGRLSYGKVRAITRVATSTDQQDWVDLAVGLPASRLTQITGRFRTVTTEHERSESETRSLTWSWDSDGMLVGSFRLAPDEGAEFIAAVTAQQTASSPQPVDSAEAEVPAAVDALLELVHGSAPGNTREGLVAATQPEVVLHVSAGDLGSDEPGRRHLADGPAIGSGAARRLACDAIVTALLHDENGAVIDVGRRNRLVTERLRRAVYERDDATCTFPGCTHSRWLDVHHLIHWEDGGRTDLNNLALLCRTHHRSHHNGDFEMSMVGGRPSFKLPDQSAIQPAPAMQALPSPSDDLLATDQGGLGPIEGQWDGQPVDTRWIIDSFALQRERALLSPAARPRVAS